jgi:uncharacterized protein (TIGR03437 family)
MKRKSRWWIAAAGLWAVAAPVALWGAPFGRVVPIGGHAADLALDERRGMLYVANFTANRIEVVSLATLAIQTSMNVPAQPASLSLSPDGRHLVVAHYGNFQAPESRNNALTVIDLETRGRQTFALGAPPLGVAFGINGLALVVTSQDFSLFDPVSGVARLLSTIPELAAKSLPVPPANFPPNIVAASLNVSGDGNRIYGLTDTFEFGYDVTSGRLTILGYSSEPPQGPRTVSVNRDGSRYLAGWVLHGAAIWDWGSGIWNLAQFPDAEGLLHLGSHAIDSARGVIYAQYTRQKRDGQNQAAGPPVLEILDGDNLAVRERIRLRENLAGKSLLSSDFSAMYAISDSGITILPVGALERTPRLQSTAEQVLFQGSFCDRRVMTREVTLYDPSGAATDFSISVGGPGVEVTPRAGVTPATVVIRADPSAFQNHKGTSGVEIQVSSAAAVNEPKPIRVLVNASAPDQRGTIVSVPGKLVDILPDPFRERFFLLRQDTNEVLVFDGQSYHQLASLRTGNTPTQMAITFDRRYLLVGHDNSQLVSVFDLETLQEDRPIRTPGGHYPRSVAASGKAILTANRVAGPVHTIDRVDMATRTATELPSLGVWENDIDKSSVLVASPNGSSILVAQKNGNVMLYSANVDSFAASRRDAGEGELKGAYAASSYDQFVVGHRLMNSSLVTTALMETATGQSSGFAFVDQAGYRTTAPSAGDPGVIQRVDLTAGGGIRATRIAEAPLLGGEEFPFTRTVAPLYSRRVIVCLTTSGFTVLPWNYDASVAPPRITSAVNAADYAAPLAPGGLISIFGDDLSPVNQATRQMPLPTALGGSCLTVNGVPMPVLFVSPRQINAQLPFHVEGSVTMILHTPGGVSDNYNLTLSPTAPSVFRSGAAGPLSDLPTVVRAVNNQLVTPANPIHAGEDIVIYLTGMGRTSPPVEAGAPAPADPPALALIPPDVSLGGVALEVRYAKLTPGLAGVYEINAHVPWWTPDGMQQPLTISQGGGSTTLSVRVVK